MKMKLKLKVFAGICIFSALFLQPISAQTVQDNLDPQLWQKAEKIAKRITIIDSHNHDLFKPQSKMWAKQITFTMLKNSSVKGLVQCLPHNPLKSDNSYEKIVKDLNEIKAALKNDSLKASIALKSGDFLAYGKADKEALLIGIEYEQGICGGNLDLLKKYYQEGVRQIGFSNGGTDSVYLKENLTDFGLKYIKELNRLGIICDITHLSDVIRNKVIDASKAPVILSHTNSRAVVNELSNAGDLTLEKLTAKGGIICVTFFSEQVSQECLAQRGKIQDITKMPRARVEELIDHIDYLKKKVGIDYVGIGSDYGGSGRLAPKGLETIEGYPLIIYYMLKRGYTENEIAKVMGLNFINYFKRVEKQAAL